MQDWHEHIEIQDDTLDSNEDDTIVDQMFNLYERMNNLCVLTSPSVRHGDSSQREHTERWSRRACFNDSRCCKETQRHSTGQNRL